MENHPIPQDITGFQFKLIGDMTIKQFGYVALGVIAGWIFFSLPFGLLKLPLASTSVLFGVALAFFPVEGRPLDIMVVNFLKALFSSSHYIYDKSGRALLVETRIIKKVPLKETRSEESQKNLAKYLSTIHKAKDPLDEKETRILEALTSGAAPATAQPTTQVKTVENPFQNLFGHQNIPQPIKTTPEEPEDEKKTKEIDNTLNREALELQQELMAAKQEEKAQTNPVLSSQAHQKVLDLEKELQEIQAQKLQLENQLATLQKQLAAKKDQAYTPSTATPTQETTRVRKVPLSMGKRVGLPIAPDTPNLITGIVKDARGNVLPNILIEVKDRDSNPVRAFKTNGLGQFAAATPLQNGLYTLWFEDSSAAHKFDPVELQMNGEIVQPLEIISMDAREELRKQLFATV